MAHTQGVHFTEYDTRLAAYALVVDDADRVLLAWYNGTGISRACWTLPGGGVEFEETPEEAVIREVYEETGYLVQVGEPLATSTFTLTEGVGPQRPFKGIRLVFGARITGGCLGTVEVGGTTDRAAWFPRHQLPVDQPMGPVVAVALDAWAGRRP